MGGWAYAAGPLALACISETKMRAECSRLDEPNPKAGCVVRRLERWEPSVESAEYDPGPGSSLASLSWRPRRWKRSSVPKPYSGPASPPALWYIAAGPGDDWPYVDAEWPDEMKTCERGRGGRRVVRECPQLGAVLLWWQMQQRRSCG